VPVEGIQALHAIYSFIMRRHGIAAAVLAAALVGAIALDGAACTGFAVYSGRTLYGMNFDYPPNEVRFSIEEHEAGALFLGSFLMGDHYASTVGMNEHGLFASDQMVFPARATVDEPAEDELFIWDAFYEGLRECESVDEVLTWIGDRHVVQYPSLQLHNLYADPSGNAMVLECGAAENVITEIEGPFLVMTNFHNGDFRGLALRDIAGVGAERYRVAHRYIEENLDGFDVDHGLEVLRRTSMATGDYRTRYSLVFDPVALEVYIALERDYDHIWKASLTERTIETYRGFDEHHVLPLDETGITEPTLQAFAPPPPEPPVVTEGVTGPRWPLIALIAAGLLGVAVLLLLKR
jgi:hypothetical protein